MIKLLLLTFLTSCSITATIAQVSITKDALPQAGTTFYYSIDSVQDKYQPPAAGENRNWDYTQFDQYYTVQDVFTKAQSSLFPDATLEEKLISNGFTYYYKSGPNGLYALGSSFGETHRKYTTPSLRYVAPFSYGATLKDSARIADSVRFNDGTAGVLTSFTRLAFDGIGYGSITTPAGHFDEVLLVRNVTVAFDTLKLKGEEPTSRTSITTTYLWVQENKDLPIVFLLNFDLSPNGKDSISTAISYFSSVLSSTTVSLGNNLVNQYPVPADQQFTVQLKEPRSGKVKFFDAQGQLSATQSFDFTDRIHFDTSAMPAGLYVYEINSDSGEILKNRITIVH